MPRPGESEQHPFFKRYIDLVKGDNITEAKANHENELLEFYNSLPESKAEYAYAEDKWTLKDILQHVIDAERIFTYRILRIARKDTTPLPGFDENSFAECAGASKRTFDSLKEEFNTVRKSTTLLFDSLSQEQLQNIGVSSNYPTSANALAFVVYGHLLHHKKILLERYL